MTLPVPTDQQIINALLAQLSDITIANGYRTDAGLVVFGEETATDAAGMSLEVTDHLETLISQTKLQRKATMQISIEAMIPYVAPVPGTPSAARAQCRAVLADIRQALQPWRSSSATLPLGMSDVEIGDRRIPPRMEGSQFVTAQIDLRITYFENLTQEVTP